MDIDELFEKAKADGFLHVYYDTPQEAVDKIRRYNEEMGECRVDRKRMKDMEGWFRIINPVLSLITFFVAMLGGKNIALTSIMTVLFLTLYFVFTMFKKNFYVISIAAALLVAVHPFNIVLVIVDILITFNCVKIDSDLKTHEGYIAFNDIRVIQSRNEAPADATNGE